MFAYPVDLGQVMTTFHCQKSEKVAIAHFYDARWKPGSRGLSGNTAALIDSSWGMKLDTI